MKHPTHSFSSPLARDLFEILAAASDAATRQEISDMERERQRDQEAEEALAEMPIQELTPQDIQHLADEWAERKTEAQRLIPRPNYRVE